jgi:hypothetical protein
MMDATAADNEQGQRTAKWVGDDTDKPALIGRAGAAHHRSATEPGRHDCGAQNPDGHTATGDDEVGRGIRFLRGHGADDEHQYEVNGYADKDNGFSLQIFARLT